MLRFLVASLLLVTMAAADASAQTKPRSRKKAAPYSVRAPRRAAVAINPHTGKPYGTGVAPEVRDGSTYLAPGRPMRRQVGYRNMGGYNDHRPHRPGIKKNANSSLNRDAATRPTRK